MTRIEFDPYATFHRTREIRARKGKVYETEYRFAEYRSPRQAAAPGAARGEGISLRQAVANRYYTGL